MKSVQSYFSTGIDIVEVKRFTSLLSNHAFMKNTFTEKELGQCRVKASRIESLAVRFAAKEAVLKSIEEKVKFNTIEVVNDSKGQPEVKLLRPDLNAKYQIALSLSHTPDYAIASCFTKF